VARAITINPSSDDSTSSARAQARRSGTPALTKAACSRPTHCSKADRHSSANSGTSAGESSTTGAIGQPSVNWLSSSMRATDW
jgi:hypothetical protein